MAQFRWCSLMGFLVFLYLELPVVELVAVLKEELVGGAEARLHTVLHHCAGAGRARQLLHLHRQIKVKNVENKAQKLPN